jgi:hypothetical protein
MVVDLDARTRETVVELVERRTTRRRRRRVALWLVGGLIAAAVIATWASGVVVSETGVGTQTPSNPVLVNPAGNLPSRWDAVMDEHSALSIGFSGSWGSIASNAGMFDVDLTGAGFTSGEYYVTVVVLNQATGWERLQVQFVALTGACAVTNWSSTPISTAIMYVETDDAHVSLTEMAGGGRYCVGIKAAPKASDPSTTYIRRPNSGVIPVMPVFAATVGQSS